MNRACKEATRERVPDGESQNESVVAGPTDAPGGPATFDGRANLGAADRKAVTNKEPSGKPLIATRQV